MHASKRILIVEDEPLIAMMLEDFLESLGHVGVGTADTIASALEKVAGQAFDAAILDVNLRGGELSWPVADALDQRNMPYLLASGGQTDAIPERFSNVPVLSKPFTMDDVRCAVDALFV